MPVMSLQVGSEIATTSRCLVSPTNLKIIGFELTGKNLVTRPSFLRTEDSSLIQMKNVLELMMYYL